MSHNLAARMAAGSSNHWKTATLLLASAFVLVAFALGGIAGTQTIDDNEPGPGEFGLTLRDPRQRASSSPPPESVLIRQCFGAGH